MFITVMSQSFSFVHGVLMFVQVKTLKKHGLSSRFLFLNSEKESVLTNEDLNILCTS